MVSPELQEHINAELHREATILKEKRKVREERMASRGGPTDKIAGGKRLTLIGQSFGGFCMLRYLSAYPDAIERCLFTCGLAPVGKPVEEVYRATFKRMEKRNARFYRRYPDEIENVRDLVRQHRIQLVGA